METPIRKSASVLVHRLAVVQSLLAAIPPPPTYQATSPTELVALRAGPGAQNTRPSTFSGTQRSGSPRRLLSPGCQACGLRSGQFPEEANR